MDRLTLSVSPSLSGYLFYCLRKRLRWKKRKDTTTIINTGRTFSYHSCLPAFVHILCPAWDVPSPPLLKCPLSYVRIHWQRWDLLPIVQMRKLRFPGAQSGPTSIRWDLGMQLKAVSWPFFKPLGPYTGHTHHGCQHHPNGLGGLF